MAIEVLREREILAELSRRFEVHTNQISKWKQEFLSGSAKYICPYLLRKLKIDHPNQVWAIDITYLLMAHGFMYLTAIIDVYSRFVVGWDVFNSLEGKGGAIDNIFIERLWRTVKQDYVYLRPAENGSELYAGLKTFFRYYNTQKSHQGIGRISPEKLYRTAA